MVKVLFIGRVEPQASAVWDFVTSHANIFWRDGLRPDMEPDLVIVAGYRRLLSSQFLTVPRLGTVGFHSARLPEYPGRAPVPWALLRGDPFTENTMFYLDSGVDSGDIIDRRRIDLRPGDTPDRVYQRMAITCVEMLEANWQGLITGTAPRTPQDMSKRGPLTTKDGWDRWFERERLATGHA